MILFRTRLSCPIREYEGQAAEEHRSMVWFQRDNHVPITLTHWWLCLGEQFGVHYLAQGYLDVVRNGVTDPLMSRWVLYLLSHGHLKRKASALSGLWLVIDESIHPCSLPLGALSLHSALSRWSWKFVLLACSVDRLSQAIWNLILWTPLSAFTVQWNKWCGLLTASNRQWAKGMIHGVANHQQADTPADTHCNILQFGFYPERR